jgi:signal transduction histidine kinase
MNAEACRHWLHHDVPEITQAADAASAMLANTMRAADIIDRVRSLYMRGTSKWEPFDLNEVIRELTVLLSDTAKRNAVSIRTELGVTLPRAAGDRVQLQQVLMNLMLNGIEAMKDTGGELTVSPKKTEDDQLLISVSDTGVGIPIDETGRVFEAFFTTKPQGTGLGLCISRRIIEAHGGRLWANPNPGRGATFQFTLPSEAAASLQSVN